MTSLRHCVKREVKRNLLMILTLVGVVLGICIGFAIRPLNPSQDALMWLGLPGQGYLRMLKMMIVPLVVGSVISGTASLDAKANGKVGIISFVFILVTNALGAILGIAAFLIFKPGLAGSDYERSNTETSKVETQDIFADLIRNIFPGNIFKATFSQDQTQYRTVESVVTRNGINETVVDVTKYVASTDGANLLGLIFACTLIGMGAASLKDRGKVFLQLVEAFTETIIVVLRWFMWMTPVGVFSLILVAIAEIDDVSGVFKDLGLFIAAVITFLCVQQLLVMPAVLFVTSRRNPVTHMWYIMRPWIICFACASTAVAIPEMIAACETKLRLDKRVTRFCVPFSVVLSANGSAVFIACACLFIANLTGNIPSAATIATIGILTTVSSLAIPSVPSSSIVTIVMILTSLNIPVEAIALLLSVDFLLDRLRTTSSCVSHTMCAAVTCHWSLGNHGPQQPQSGDVEMSLDVGVAADKQSEIIKL